MGGVRDKSFQVIRRSLYTIGNMNEVAILTSASIEEQKGES